MKAEGLDAVNSMFGEIGAMAEAVATGSLFDGAGVMADAYKKAVSSIKTEPFKGKRDKRLPSPEEKAAIMGKTGIATFDKNGSEVNTVIGFASDPGYVMLGRKKRAVKEIARSINSGTSFMAKQPVFRRAKNSASKAASAAIVNKADAMLEALSK